MKGSTVASLLVTVAILVAGTGCPSPVTSEAEASLDAIQGENLARTGVGDPSAPRSKPTEAWSAEYPDDHGFTLVAGQYVAILYGDNGGHRGGLEVRDLESGELVWEVELPNEEGFHEFPEPLQIENGTIYLQLAEQIMGYDLASGEEKRVPLELEPNYRWIIVDDTLIIGHSDQVSATNITTGETVWKASTPKDFLVSSAPSIDDGIIYLGIQKMSQRVRRPSVISGGIVGFDLSTGKQVFEYSDAGSFAPEQPPSIVDSRLISAWNLSGRFASLFNRASLYLIDPEAPEQTVSKDAWSAQDRDYLKGTRVAADESAVYVVNEKDGQEGGINPVTIGQLLALDTEDASVLWSLDLQRNTPSVPVISGSLVLVAAQPNRTTSVFRASPSGPGTANTQIPTFDFSGSDLYAVDKLSGELLWTIELDEQFIQPPIVSEGRIIVTTWDTRSPLLQHEDEPTFEGRVIVYRATKDEQ